MLDPTWTISAAAAAATKNWPFTLIRELGPHLSNPNLFFILFYFYSFPVF
jgi:hypothetical protein